MGLDMLSTMTSEWILGNEAPIRLSAYLSIFVIMALWEIVLPRRRLTTSKSTRWFSNIGIVVLNTLLLRAVFSTAAVATAWEARERGLGLLNQLEMPLWVAVAISVLVLDLVIYLQHVMFHAVPALWRLHMVHHADLDYDVTTGSRFHPVEILLSMIIKVVVVGVLGPPVVAVVVFEVLLNATAMFNHSNVRIPLAVDRVLRWFVVTPDMHRVHHSVVPVETNSNFGFNLPWWDRLLGTYVDQPASGHQKMTIGLRQFREAARLTLPWMLLLPFIGRPGSYSFRHPGRG
jgi:sterol desaturase/sphingolipid hydroxylase (fatty acid hydroxylase superfamily)